jgi:hypothetical protein
MKKSTQNKTEYIQFRVDSTVKDLAKKTANEHFDGNMSDMFRYSLYHCDFSGEGDNVNYDTLENSFTPLGEEVSRLLATIHEDYMSQNKELNHIGNNINQLAHHVNDQSISSPSPITRRVADALEDIRKALNANRTVNANIWKKVREHFTNKQS